MEREGFKLPLLIGGATTSRAHTAVKIAPAYAGTVVHVLDASRAVGVAGQLKSPEARGAPSTAQNREAQEQAARRAPREAGPAAALPIEEASGARTPLDWKGYAPPAAVVPRRDGRRPLAAGGHRPLHRLVAVLRGLGDDRHLPAHLRQPGARGGGAAALRRRPAAARPHRAREAPHGAGRLRVLRRERRRRRHRALHGRVAVGPARHAAHAAAAEREAGGPAEPGPRRFRRARWRAASPTTVGAFAVTRRASASSGSSRSSSAITTTTRAIMAKALADRLAEALAEALHKRAREEWGYGRDESLSSEELIRERYRGIRPAPGYPACPDHSEKRVLFDLLAGGAPGAASGLTETFAMIPAAAVERPLLLAPGGALLHGRPSRAATRSWTTRGARGCRWRTSSAGCRPTSTTSRTRKRPARSRLPRSRSRSSRMLNDFPALASGARSRRFLNRLAADPPDARRLTDG